LLRYLIDSVLLDQDRIGSIDGNDSTEHQSCRNDDQQRVNLVPSQHNQ